jgi:hypothetical protein
MINLGAKLFGQLAVKPKQHFFNECKGDTTTTIIATIPLMSLLITPINVVLPLIECIYN